MNSIDGGGECFMNRFEFMGDFSNLSALGFDGDSRNNAMATLMESKRLIDKHFGEDELNPVTPLITSNARPISCSAQQRNARRNTNRTMKEVIGLILTVSLALAMVAA